MVAQSASATIVPMLESSYHDGFVFYSQDGLNGRIDFAVYDTEHPLYGDEYQDNGLEKPGDGRYVYAYQVFNDYLASEESVAYFAVLGGHESTVSGIGSQEDPETGIAPGSQYFDTDLSQVMWEFDGDDGYVLAGEHSWFLVFGSDQTWVKGDYEIGGPDYVPVPVPEPATIVLLGLAGAAVLVRRRKPVK
jgi:hypothetical protein